MTEPQRIQIAEGETAQLPCVASGAPSPTYHWQKVMSQSSVAMEMDSDPRLNKFGGNLEIKEVKLEDEGIYRCIAVNDMGERSIEHTILVKGWYSIV